MIFPKGKPLYENLNTSFTNFGELLLNLQINSVTGYVQVSFWEYEGILFLDSGNVVNAVEEARGSRKVGQEAVSAITAQVKERDGTLSVYALSPEMVVMLTSVVKSEVVYKDLSTDFTSLDKLIGKLKSEGHTGYVEVVMRDGKSVGVIFFQDGGAIESMLSTNGDAYSGVETMPRIVEAASALGATFNVYKAAVEEAFAAGTEIATGFALPELLKAWQAIIAAVERVADSQFKSGQFLNIFKDTLIEKADDYLFLDPFAGEFDYRDGQITFHAEGVKDFSRALGDCLNITAGKLASEAPQANLTARIKAELEAVKETHAAAIEKFDLAAALPQLLS
jgi:hypothetical protein